MKIAIWHNLPSGGGKRALYEHIKGLVARGHQVEAWCPPTADQSFLPLCDLVPEHILPLSWKPLEYSKRWSRPYVDYHNNNARAKIRAMNHHCQQCADQIERGGFDVLFTNACQIFRVTSIGRMVNLPRLIYLQEPYRLLYEAMPTLPWVGLPSSGKMWWTPTSVKRFVLNEIRLRWLRLQARAELENAQAYNAILVNSLFSREMVIRAYGLDAKVCYLGIDTDLFIDQGNDKREDFVIGVSSFLPEKNIGLVIQALSCLKEPRPRLYWVGNVAKNAYLEELQGLAASMGIGFEPLMRISDAQLIDLLNRAMLMVYAPRLEPFGYAPLEANACGTPVVAVAEGGVRETVIDGVNGLLVEHSPYAIAEAVERLRSDTIYARRLGQNGHELVLQRWSLPASIDRLEARLEEVLCGNISSHQE